MAFNDYNPITDTSLPKEVRLKYVKEGVKHSPPKEETPEERAKRNRERMAREADALQMARNGMTLEQQEQKLMREYSRYMARPTAEDVAGFKPEIPEVRPDPPDAPQYTPYTQEQINQMNQSFSNQVLYGGSYYYNNGYNPYWNAGYNGYAYAYNGAYSPTMYSQFMNEEQQRITALREEQLNIMSILISGARTGATGVMTTPEEVKKELLTPPQKRIEDEYAKRKLVIHVPGIRLTVGDKVIKEVEAHDVEYSGRDLMLYEQEEQQFRATIATAVEGNVVKAQQLAWVNQQREAYRKKYPLSMKIDEFWDHYGTEMYHDYIDDLVQKQQKKLMGLYDSNEFSKVLRQFMKKTNPYGYSIYQNAMMNTNNGYINMSGPVNVNDLEVSLPNHLRNEADKRRSEFFARIMTGRTQGPGQSP